jgi:hypothetical protein
VVCRFGGLKDGQKATGAIRAKVSRHAEPGDTIGLRGTVTWGGTRAAVVFPVVRVARPTALALSMR